MQVEFTLRGRDGDLGDVLVTGPPDTPLGLLPARLAALGLPVGAALWCGDRPIAAGERLASLRNGAVLGAGIGIEQAPSAALSLDVVGGPAAGLSLPLSTGRVTIGRAPACDVCLDGDADASRLHAVLQVGRSAVLVADAGSTNGTHVEASPVVHEAALENGQLLRLGDSFVSVRRAAQTPATVRKAAGRWLVNRPPRPPAARAGEVLLPSSPVKPAPQRIQVLAALLPAAAGIAFAWTLHAPQFLFFALLSPVMLLATSLGDRMHWRRSRRREGAAYRRAMDAAATAIAEGLRREAAERRNRHPDPVAVAAVSSLPGSRLWERRRTDADHLDVRLGLADLASELTVRDGAAARPAGRCTAVPLTTSLRAGALGVAGPPAPVRALGRWLLAQLSAQHSPADVEVVVLAGDDAQWRWARWLPHLRSHGRDPAGWAELAAELTDLADERRRVRARSSDDWSGPWLVVFVDALVAVELDVPALAQLLTSGQDVGITGVWLGSRVEALPAGCTSIAEVLGATGSRVRMRRADADPEEAVLDQVREPWAESVARALASLADGDADAAATLPTRCRLPELLGEDASDAGIRRRWARSRHGAAAVVGLDADGPLELDLVRDGPHALVAGTTGSGKSELLQTLVTALAVNHPPEQLTFLLIDYKGGAAFAECARLPHTVGLVTDLDAHLTARALRSLDAEILRRERLFAAAGAADLAAYAATGPAEPVPRLVIVVDEFATLAEELPDFMRGLVGIAQRGRSLGLHLVLATQRPGGVVSADIRANAELRIALRVADPGESSDLIGAPDAAGIDRRAPGRAYVRDGSAPRAFQTAWVGGPASRAHDELIVERLGPWRSRAIGVTTDAPTDLAVLAERIATAAAGAPPARSPWRDPLPTMLRLDAAFASTGAAVPAPGRVPIGLMDLPAQQRQETYTVDLDTPASLLIAGGPRSGRSTALATLALQAARRMPPDELHLHVIDAAGGLAALRGLPHCGTYAGPNSMSDAATLIERLGAVVDNRRRDVVEHGTSAGAPHPAAARLLLVVDGWEVFAPAADERDAGRTTDALITLARTGASVGLMVAVTGDRTVLSPRVAGAFAERLLLPLGDRSDYGMAGLAARDVPEHVLPGRAVRARDAVEIQLGFVGAAPSGAEQGDAATRLALRHPHGAHGAIRIRRLPTEVALHSLPAPRGRWVLGLGGDSATPITLDPAAGIRMVVAGPPRSGRTTMLRSLLAQAVRTDVIVAAPARSGLRADADSSGVPVLSAEQCLPPGFATAPGSVLLIDDVDHLADGVLAEQITALVRAATTGCSVIAAGRSDDLATSYRGLAAELRRNRCGLLLRPSPVDGDIIGARLPRYREQSPPGRGLLVGEAAWGPEFSDGALISIQVATP